MQYLRYIIPLIFFYSLIAPPNVLNNYLQSIFPIILFVSTQNIFRKFNVYALSIVSIIALSFVLNSASNEIEFKEISRMLSLSLMIFMFPFVSISNFKPQYIIISFLIIFLSQLAFVFDFSIIKEFINTYYIDINEEKYTLEKIREVSDFSSDFINKRYGGLFLNPNQCARYVTLLFALFLIEFKRKNKIIFFIVVITFFISIILTGSRTGFIVLTFLLIYNYFKSVKLNMGLIKNIFILSFIFGILILMFSIIEVRNLKLEEAYEGSMEMKIELFFDYLLQSATSGNLTALFFGNFSIAFSEKFNIPVFDSEFGNIVFTVGFFGLIAIFLFYRKIFINSDKNVKLIFILLLWTISSSILFSFKMSFLFLFVLSNYYANYLENQKSQKSIISEKQ